MTLSSRLLTTIIASTAIGSNTASSAITFTEVSRFAVDFASTSDLDPNDGVTDDNPKYIGTNALGVAWNGSRLYLAGFDNNSQSFLPVGLIEVLDATRTGALTLSDADFSDPFGQILQVPGRGYTGIDLQGDRLAAAFDNGGPTSDGIQLFDTTDNSQEWEFGTSNPGGSVRGGSGVAFDPGFPGGDPAFGTGVAWTTFGSGRRALQDTEFGFATWDLDESTPDTVGMQWLSDDSPAGNFARDLAFDPATGDIYARRSNDVDAADRIGDNATENRRTIVDNGSNGNFTIGQKIEFLGDTASGDVLIYNDSATNALGQTFADVVRVIDTDGGPVDATYNLLGGETLNDLGTGAGIYDFSYDPATETLAVLDFTNRNVHIFEVGGATVGVTGDYNRDGVVDAADYTVWRDTIGQNVSEPGDGADGNANGVVDASDYDPWADNFGATASAVAVPEPSAALLAAFAVACRAFRRSKETHANRA